MLWMESRRDEKGRISFSVNSRSHACPIAGWGEEMPPVSKVVKGRTGSKRLAVYLGVDDGWYCLRPTPSRAYS